jgi:hypothetical protein
MSDQDIFVSNGTCYSAAGEKLDESFIPCGNVAYGHQTCCGQGDNCLADNACFGYHGNGYGSQLTYMAGCTDPNYEDGSCPKKEFGECLILKTHIISVFDYEPGYIDPAKTTAISCSKD